MYSVSEDDAMDGEVINWALLLLSESQMTLIKKCLNDKNFFSYVNQRNHFSQLLYKAILTV